MKLHLPVFLRKSILAGMASCVCVSTSSTAWGGESYMAEGVHAQNLTASERFYDNGKGYYWSWLNYTPFMGARSLYESTGSFAFLGDLASHIDTGSGFSTSSFSALTNDANTCWYNVASNVLQYWQSYYGVFAKDIVYGYTYNKDYADDLGGTQSLKVGMYFYDNWTNDGGNLFMAANWYLAGDDSYYNYPYAASLKYKGKGGFFAEYFGEESATVYSYAEDIHPSSFADELASHMGMEKQKDGSYQLIRKGQLVDLSIEHGGYGHALTCYGFTVSDSGMIESVQVTNSDDQSFKLITLYVKYDDGAYHLYEDKACTKQWVYSKQTWQISSISSIRTPDILLQMYDSYTDADNALVWNGQSDTWSKPTYTPTTEELPDGSSGWDIKVMDEHYHAHAESERKVRFDDHATRGMVKVQGAVETEEMHLDNDSLQYSFSGTTTSSSILADAFVASGTGAATFSNVSLSGSSAQVTRYTLELGEGSNMTYTSACLEAGSVLKFNGGSAAFSSLTLGEYCSLVVAADVTLSVDLLQSAQFVIFQYVEVGALLAFDGSLDAAAPIRIDYTCSAVEDSRYALIHFEDGLSEWADVFYTSYGTLSYANNTLYLSYKAIEKNIHGEHFTSLDSSLDHSEIVLDGRSSGYLSVDGAVALYAINVTDGSYVWKNGGTPGQLDVLDCIAISGDAVVESRLATLEGNQLTLSDTAQLILNADTESNITRLSAAAGTSTRVASGTVTFENTTSLGKLLVDAGAEAVFCNTQDLYMSGLVTSNGSLTFLNGAGSGLVTYTLGQSGNVLHAVTIGEAAGASPTLVSLVVPGDVSGSFTIKGDGELVLSGNGVFSATATGSGTLTVARDAVMEMTVNQLNATFDSSLNLNVKGDATVGSDNALLAGKVCSTATVSGSLQLYGAQKEVSLDALAMEGGTFTADNHYYAGLPYASFSRRIGQLTVGAQGGTLISRMSDGYSQFHSVTDIGSLSGTGNLTIQGESFIGMHLYRVASLGEDGYSGKITLLHNNRSWAQGYTYDQATILSLGSMEMEGSVYLKTLTPCPNPEANSCFITALGIDGEVSLGGLDSTDTPATRVYLYSGSLKTGIMLTHGASFSSFINKEEHTLTLDVDDEHRFSGAVCGSLNLVKKGSGEQSFLGDMSAFDGSVEVQKGTLNMVSLGNASTITLSGSGSTLGVTSGVHGNTLIANEAGAVLSADLTLAGGSLTLGVDKTWAQTGGLNLDCHKLIFDADNKGSLAIDLSGYTAYSGEVIELLTNVGSIEGADFSTTLVKVGSLFDTGEDTVLADYHLLKKGNTLALVMNGEVDYSEWDVVHTTRLTGDVNVRSCKSVSFIGITTSGFDDVYGGAIGGGDITLSNNGSVIVSGNTASVTDSTIPSAYGGAIYTQGNLSIRNNDSVLFEKNVEKTGSTYRLRSIYAEGTDDEVSLSAEEGKLIEFRDSVYIGSGATVNLNADYTDTAGVVHKQKGDILFTGAYAETHLNEMLEADGAGRTATAEEIRLSQTTEVLAMTHLYGGRLRVEDGAIYKGYGITAEEGSDSTVRVKDATLDHAGYDLTFNAGTTMELVGTNSISGNVQMLEGSTLRLIFDDSTETGSSMTLSSDMFGGLTLKKGSLVETVGSDGKDLVFAGNATEINADIRDASENGTLNLMLQADGDMRVNGDVVTDSISVTNGKDVSFFGTVNTGALTAEYSNITIASETEVSGDMTVAGLLVQSGGSLTVGGALKGQSLSVDGSTVNATSIILNGGALTLSGNASLTATYVTLTDLTLDGPWATLAAINLTATGKLTLKNGAVFDINRLTVTELEIENSQLSVNTLKGIQELTLTNADAIITGGLTGMTGNITLQANAEGNGSYLLTSVVDIDGTLSVSGNSDAVVTGNITADAGISVDGESSITGLNITTAGAITAAGDSTITASGKLKGESLSVDGSIVNATSITLNGGDLTATNGASVNSNVAGAADATIIDSTAKDITMTGALVATNATIGNVSGATSVDLSKVQSGSIAMGTPSSRVVDPDSRDLEITDGSLVNGNITNANDLTIDSSIITGSVAMDGALSATNATIQGGLGTSQVTEATISGSTIGSGIDSTGKVEIDKSTIAGAVSGTNVTIKDQSTAGDVTASGTATITGSTVGSITSTNGSITADGATIGGDVTAKTDSTITNSDVDGNVEVTAGKATLDVVDVTGTVKADSVEMTGGSAASVKADNGDVSIDGGATVGTVEATGNAAIIGGQVDTVTSTGGNVTMTGVIAGDVTAKNGTVTADSNTSMGAVGADTAVMNGATAESLTAGDLTVGSEGFTATDSITSTGTADIDGEVNAGGSITLKDADIDANVTAGDKLSINGTADAEGVTLSGTNGVAIEGTLNAGEGVALKGAVTGTGTINKTGGDILDLGGDTDLTGGAVNVTDSTLNAGDGASLGNVTLSGSTITVAGDVTADYVTTENATIEGQLTINKGAGFIGGTVTDDVVIGDKDEDGSADGDVTAEGTTFEGSITADNVTITGGKVDSITATGTADLTGTEVDGNVDGNTVVTNDATITGSVTADSSAQLSGGTVAGDVTVESGAAEINGTGTTGSVVADSVEMTGGSAASVKADNGSATISGAAIAGDVKAKTDATISGGATVGDVKADTATIDGATAGTVDAATVVTKNDATITGSVVADTSAQLNGGTVAGNVTVETGAADITGTDIKGSVFADSVTMIGGSAESVMAYNSSAIIKDATVGNVITSGTATIINSSVEQVKAASLQAICMEATDLTLTDAEAANSIDGSISLSGDVDVAGSLEVKGQLAAQDVRVGSDLSTDSIQVASLVSDGLVTLGSEDALHMVQREMSADVVSLAQGSTLTVGGALTVNTVQLSGSAKDALQVGSFGASEMNFELDRAALESLGIGTGESCAIARAAQAMGSEYVAVLNGDNDTDCVAAAYVYTLTVCGGEVRMQADYAYYGLQVWYRGTWVGDSKWNNFYIAGFDAVDGVELVDLAGRTVQGADLYVAYEDGVTSATVQNGTLDFEYIDMGGGQWELGADSTVITEELYGKGETLVIHKGATLTATQKLTLGTLEMAGGEISVKDATINTMDGTAGTLKIADNGQVTVKSDVTLTGLNNEGTLNLGKNNLTVNALVDEGGNVTAGQVMVQSQASRKASFDKLIADKVVVKNTLPTGRYTDDLSVGDGSVIGELIAETLEVRGGMVTLGRTEGSTSLTLQGLDLQNDATLLLNQQTQLAVTESMSATENATVQLKQGAGISYGATSISNGGQVETTTVNAYELATGNLKKVENAHVAVDSDADTTVDYQLVNSTLEKHGKGTLTVTSEGNSINAVSATGGTINVMNVASSDLESIMKLASLELHGGATFGAYTGDTADAAQEAWVQVTNSAVFGSGTTINADLELMDGCILTLNGPVNMGSDLKINGTITLNGDLLEQILSADLDTSFVLFTGIDNLYLHGTQYDSISLSDKMSASDYFAGLNDDEYRRYWLTYESTVPGAGVLSVHVVVPEPTTTTLSLLALAALVARRRRR